MGTRQRYQEFLDEILSEPIILMKPLPFGEVWKEYCNSCGVPTDGQWMKTVEGYENSVLRKRV